jgi:uridine kinase
MARARRVRRDELIDVLWTMMRSKKSPSKPLLVGIDGVDAAGKTCLADELAEAGGRLGLRALRASIDGFHNPRDLRYRRGPDSAEGYYRDSFDYQALRSALLDPLKQGASGSVVARAYDFRSESAVGPCPVPFDGETILIFEGVFLQCAELAGYWDFLVYVHAGFETTLARAEGRDRALFGAVSEVKRKYLNRYIPGQRLYIRERAPIENAHAVVLNERLDDPELVLDRERRAELAAVALGFDGRHE